MNVVCCCRDWRLKVQNDVSDYRPKFLKNSMHRLSFVYFFYYSGTCLYVYMVSSFSPAIQHLYSEPRTRLEIWFGQGRSLDGPLNISGVSFQNMK